MAPMHRVRHRPEDTKASAARPRLTHRPVWNDLARRFSGESEFLAAYLALETAEVIGGAKPANLLNLADRTQACGRNLYRLWLRDGERLLNQAGLAARELSQRRDGVLLLVYHPGRLQTHLKTPRVANFLRCAGYRQPEIIESTLAELADRFAADGFPHEIGALLGYPLKDVAGFMGWVRLPVTAQGPWKIYGDPRSSLDIVATCRACRQRVARQLADCTTPFDCLKAFANADTTWLCPPFENEHHLH